MVETPELLQSLLKFSEYATTFTSVNLDLCKEPTIYPTTLLPLLNFIEEKKKVIKCTHAKSSIVEEVMTKLQREEKVELSNENCYAIKLKPNKEPTAVNTLYKLRNNQSECGGENTFKLLIGELVDNIYEHSKFTNALIMGQKYQEREFIELTFFDNGITIPGTYKNQGLTFTDNEALYQATCGLSTKGEERGRGLRYTIGAVTQGLAGEILIASGKAAIYKSLNILPLGSTLSFEFVKEPPFKGTLISMRIPFSTKTIDYTKLVEQSI